MPRRLLTLEEKQQRAMERKEYQRAYRMANKAKLNEYNRTYRENNKDKNPDSNEKWECAICNKTMFARNKAKHLKSKTHINNAQKPDEERKVYHEFDSDVPTGNYRYKCSVCKSVIYVYGKAKHEKSVKHLNALKLQTQKDEQKKEDKKEDEPKRVQKSTPKSRPAGRPVAQKSGQKSEQEEEEPKRTPWKRARKVELKSEPATQAVAPAQDEYEHNLPRVHGVFLENENHKTVGVANLTKPEFAYVKDKKLLNNDNGINVEKYRAIRKKLDQISYEYARTH